MKDCRGELLERVRRGWASDQERAAFEAHWDSCESCRMTLEVLGDFDAVDEAESGDWQRVARMAVVAVKTQGVSRRARPRVAGRTWLLAGAALVVASAAVAGVGVALDFTTQRELPPREEHAMPSAPAAPALASGAEQGSTRDVVDSIEVPAEPTSADEAPGARSPTAPPVQSATDVYRAANEARRSGNAEEATRGYRLLQRQYPAAPETHASRVSLGGLLLRGGSASAAFTQFDSYVRGGGGALMAEALFGRAQALRALGRSTEEALDLDRLVKEYPSSAYATHAQRRLHQLR